jgi:outer membrane protein OmpA-like peptidoglycan-associated protein
MFRWVSGGLATAAAVAAAAGVASGRGVITGGPIVRVSLPTMLVDLPRTAIDGSMSINRARITLQSDVLFAFGSATLSRRASVQLRAVTRELERRNPRTIRVEGYTDNRGSSSYNLKLSRARAASVREALAVGRTTGVPIHVVGRGEGKPLVSNTTARGRALNRRVEIRFR